MLAQLFLAGFGLLSPLIFLTLVFLLLLLLANRGAPDPTGRRPFLIYLLSVTFLGLLLVLLAATAVVGSLTGWLIGDRFHAIPGPDSLVTASAFQTQGCAPVGDGSIVCGGWSSGIGPLGGGDLTAAALSLIVLFAAGLLTRFHWRRAREIVDEPGFATGPSRGVYETYLYATCFAAVLLLVAGGVLAARPLAALPRGYLGSGSALGSVLTFAVLAYGSFLIARAHWRRAAALRDLPPDAARPAEPEPAPRPAPRKRSPRKPS